MIKPTQSYWVTVNNVTLGMLQSYEEELTQEIKTLRPYAKNEISLLRYGALSYTITLKRLRTDIADVFAFEALHGFTLTLVSEERQLSYTGCEVASVRLQIGTAGAVIEEATILAQTREISS